MGMRYTELVSWAKKYGYKVERYDSGLIKWNKIDDESVCGESENKDKIATDIYNDITDNEWLEYQRRYAEHKAQRDIRFNPPP